MSRCFSIRINSTALELKLDCGLTVAALAAPCIEDDLRNNCQSHLDNGDGYNGYVQHNFMGEYASARIMDIAYYYFKNDNLPLALLLQDVCKMYNECASSSPENSWYDNAKFLQLNVTASY